MRKFIYVFSDKDRDRLLSMHYELLKSDHTKNIYVFVNKERLDFEVNDVRFVLSDTLTF